MTSPTGTCLIIRHIPWPLTFPFPAVGHVVKEGNGFRWLPADWVWTTKLDATLAHLATGL